MTDLEKEKIKNLLYIWGSYKYIISAEKRELEDIKLMYKNMRDIKEVCIDNKNKLIRVNSPVADDFRQNIKLCEGRLEKLNHLIKSNMTVKTKIDNIVDTLPYVEKYILQARYIKNLSWDNMPLNLPFSMSKRHCQRYHNTAVDKIYNSLKEKGEL